MRAHRWLMPDYPRRAAAYWWIVSALGWAVFGHSLWSIAQQPASELLKIGSLVAVALLAGLFPLRIPRSNNSFMAGEIFIFLALLMSGPPAAAIAAAGEGAVGAWRTSKRWTSRIISPAVACLAMYGSGSLLQALVESLRQYQLANAGVLLLTTMATAVLYFTMVSGLLSVVPILKRGAWPTLGELFEPLGWIGLSFAGSASVACLLYLSYEQAGIAVLVAAVPIIAMLLTALHGLFRQQESADSLRRSKVEAAEREAELSARHLRELELSERRFHSAFTHASIGMALVDLEGRAQQVNPALCKLLGVADPRLILDRVLSHFVLPTHADALDAALHRLRDGVVHAFNEELPLRGSAGHEVWASVHGSVFAEHDMVSARFILQVHDVTARRHAEAGLRQIAFHDSLTGLPNRRRFLELLTQALARTKVDQHGGFALLFLDFDRFKVINDSMGHAVGDEFLVAVARRIQQQLRPHDVVARLGGDEFAILAGEVESGRSVVVLAERILEALRSPVAVGGIEIVTSTSIGITLSTLGYDSPDEMLRDADTAMYKAKNSGRGRYALFDTALHTQVALRMRLEGELRRALAGNALSVAFQPILALESGALKGFEALARWNHDELGPIAPSDFIPIAEESGQIMALTDFVLDEACRQLKVWQSRHPALGDVTVHVNLSGQDIGHAKLGTRVASVLSQSGLPPRCLTLELTESILMDRLAAAVPMLDQVRDLGVGLSIDDFGSGYTSLQHLSALPVNSLKVDAAFVRGLERGAKEAAVLRAILLLGASLDKTVVAEGIETEAQLNQLRQLGCTAGQGYLLCKPLTPDEVGAMLGDRYGLESSAAS